MKSTHKITLLGCVCLILVMTAMTLIVGCGDSTPTTSAPAATTAAPAATTSAPAATTSAPAATTSAPAATTEPTKVINLTANSPVFPVNPLDKALVAWAADFGEKTGGRYAVEVVSGGTIASTTESYDALVNGISDIALFQPPMTERPFPLTNLPVLFWGPVSSVIMTEAWQAVYNQGYLDDELSEIKPLYLNVGPVGDIDTVNPINTLADLNGVKLANAQGSTCVDLATRLGAVSVLAGPPDIYVLLQKGTAEGIFGAVPMIKEFVLDEFVRYLLPIQVSHMSHMVGMNLDVYNNLPDDIKLIIEDMSADRKYSLLADEGNDLWYEDGLQYCYGQGLTKITWSDEDIAELNRIAGEIWEETMVDLEAQGLPAREVCDLLYNTMLDLGATPSEIAIGYTPNK